MARNLGIPITEHSFDDVLLQIHAKKLGEPQEKSVLQLYNIRKFLDVSVEGAKECMNQFSLLDTNKTGHINLEQVNH